MATRIVVLLSGSGTTLQNLIDRIEAGTLDVQITGVVSSRADAFGLERAQRHGIATACVVRREQPSAEAAQRALWAHIRGFGADLVVLAGYMSLLHVPADYENRIINVHPSLIPAFCGKGMYGHHVHKAVLAYGAKVTGATVHFVDEHYDNGPIITQQAVPVLEDDTPDTLAARVQATEREIYPQAIALFAAGRLRIEGRRVHIAP